MFGWSRVVLLGKRPCYDLKASKSACQMLTALQGTEFPTQEWNPSPVSLPGKREGQRSLVGYSPWGCKESDTTYWLNNNKSKNEGRGEDNHQGDIYPYTALGKEMPPSEMQPLPWSLKKSRHWTCGHLHAYHCTRGCCLITVLLALRTHNILVFDSWSSGSDLA